jgi:hypothetical protein
MQCAYRRVLGTEDPIGADVLNRYYLIKNNVAETGYSGGSGIKPEGSGIKPESPPDTPKKQSREPTDNELKLVAAAPPPGSGSPSVKPLPLNIPYDSFVKPGWFGVGRKKEVPRRGVCYVGHYCDTYVWVTRCNTQDLTDFTLAIVDIATPATIDVSGQIVRQNNPFAGLPPPPPAPPNVR